MYQFEGVITEVLPGYVVADLVDLTDRSRPYEYAEINLSEFPWDDRHLVVPGCVFYWSIIGEESTIRIRKTPDWTDAEIQQIKADGEKIFERMKQWQS